MTKTSEAKKKAAAKKKKDAAAKKAGKKAAPQQPYLDASLAPKHAAELEPLMSDFCNSREKWSKLGKKSKEEKERIQGRMRDLKIKVYKFIAGDFEYTFHRDSSEELKVEKKELKVKAGEEPKGEGGRVK